MAAEASLSQRLRYFFVVFLGFDLGYLVGTFSHFLDGLVCFLVIASILVDPEHGKATEQDRQDSPKGL